MRAIVLTHRYLGIAIGLLMAMWCLSGVVMMYVPYPHLGEQRRLTALPTLDWSACCALDDLRKALPADTPVDSFEVEMLGARPVLRAWLDGKPTLFDLREGRILPPLRPDDADLQSIAARFAAPGANGEHSVVTRDQWTVGGFGSDRPLFRLAFDDDERTQVYLSSRTGKAVQLTTKHERFWNWLGAVPHWLYPTALRRHAVAWSQLVVWTSVVGCFLTITGIYIGIRRLTRQRSTGRIASPFRGIHYWHHVPGLIFGLLALTWVASGLLSMNPWGLLESPSAARERDALRGAAPTWQNVLDAVRAIEREHLLTAVSYASAPLDDELFLVATLSNGARRRFDQSAAFAPLSDGEIAAAADRLQRGAGDPVWSVLEDGDSYYYSYRNDAVVFPAIRVHAARPADVTYYLDGTSGALVQKVDDAGRGFRWWHNGLHRLDFIPALRSSVVRSSLMLPLLLGASFVCATGAYLGFRRLTRRSPG